MLMGIAEAAKLRQTDLVRHLLGCYKEDAGSSLETTDGEYNGTALYWMTVNGELAVVRALLESGANVNASNIYKHTPLHAAADMGFLDTLKLLLKYGARTDVLNKNRQTPLHLAAYRGYHDIVESLLKAGADQTIQNSRLLTPLQESFAMNHRQVVSLLCKDKVALDSLKSSSTRVQLTRTRSHSPRTINSNCRPTSVPPTSSYQKPYPSSCASLSTKRHKSEELLLSSTVRLHAAPTPTSLQHQSKTTTSPGFLRVCQPIEHCVPTIACKGCMLK